MSPHSSAISSLCSWRNQGSLSSSNSGLPLAYAEFLSSLCPGSFSFLVSSFYSQHRRRTLVYWSGWPLLNLLAEWCGSLSSTSSGCLGSPLIRYALPLQPICLLLEEPHKTLIYPLAISYCHHTDMYSVYQCYYTRSSVCSVTGQTRVGTGLAGLSVAELISRWCFWQKQRWQSAC